MVSLSQGRARPALPEEPEATFRCRAVDGEERTQVEVEVRDVQGALTYTIV